MLKEKRKGKNKAINLMDLKSLQMETSTNVHLYAE